MKKLFLFFAASALVISAVAQKPAVNPTPVKVSQNLRTIVLDSTVNSSLSLPKPLGSNSKGYTPIWVGTSSSYLSIQWPTQNQLCYEPATNTLGFTHRGGPTMGTTAQVLTNISTNGGSVWDTTANTISFSNSSYLARYPSGTLFNPQGNTDPANVYSIVVGSSHIAPALNFGSTYIGWKKRSGTAKSYVIVHNRSGRTQDNRHLTVCNDGRFYCAGEDHDDNGTVYTKWRFTLVSGKLNPSTDTVEDVKTTYFYPPFAKFKTDTLGSVGSIEGAVAFNKAGTVGYYVTIGVRGDVANPAANTSYRPIVYKTTDQGANWNIQPDYDFSNVPVFKDLISGLNRDTTIIRPRFFPLTDILVDGNDQLHLMSYVYAATSDHVDSLDYYSGYQNIQGLLFDTYTKNDGTWDATLIDIVNAKDNTPSAPSLKIDARLQAGISEDGKNIFYTWVDTDGDISNILPNLFLNNRHIDSTTINRTKTNVTLGTTLEYVATYHTMAPQVKQNGSEFDVYTIITQLGAAQNTDPVKYWFLNGLKVITSVNNFDKNIQSISNIKPNPTTGVSTINISILKSCNVSINVVNMMGQVVSTENYGQKAEGSHDLRIDASNLTSGIYFVTVKAGNSTSTSKMIVQ